MNVGELGAFGGFASPFAVLLGLAISEWRGSKREARLAAQKDAERDAADKALAAEIKVMGEAAAAAELSHSNAITALSERLGEAIGEFKKSNEAHAVHEKECALFRGETVAALRSTAETLRSMSTGGERIAKLEQRVDSIDGKIDYGARKMDGHDHQFAEVARRIGALRDNDVAPAEIEPSLSAPLTRRRRAGH